MNQLSLGLSIDIDKMNSGLRYTEVLLEGHAVNHCKAKFFTELQPLGFIMVAILHPTAAHCSHVYSLV